MAERGFENAFLLSGGIDEFALAHPEFIEGRCVPRVDPKKMMTKNHQSAKIEVNRQPIYSNSKANVSRRDPMLPSIPKKGGAPSKAQGFRYDAAAKRRTGSAGMNRNQIFNDIPDTDSYVTGKDTGLKKLGPGGNRGGSRGRPMSKKEIQITEKPGNVVFGKDGGSMYRERKLEKLNKDLTDKLTNAHGLIKYDYY
jgi:hypothetical protein